MTVFIVIFDEGEIDSVPKVVKVFDSWAKAEAFLADPEVSVRDPQVAEDEYDWSDYEVVVAGVVHGSYRAREQAERAAATLRERAREFFTVEEWDVE